MAFFGDRRNFIKKALSIAGLGALPTGMKNSSHFFSAPSQYVVEFQTFFPYSMSLHEYRSLKEDFENKEKFISLLNGFKKAQKIQKEHFHFHETFSRWQVTFSSKASFDEWMILTEALNSHDDEERARAGFRMDIVVLV